MEEDGLVAVFRDEAGGGLHAFRMVRNVVLVERPEVLFMGEEVDDFRRVRAGHVLLYHGDDVFDRRVVDDACEA